MRAGARLLARVALPLCAVGPAGCLTCGAVTLDRGTRRPQPPPPWPISSHDRHPAPARPRQSGLDPRPPCVLRPTRRAAGRPWGHDYPRRDTGVGASLTRSRLDDLTGSSRNAGIAAHDRDRRRETTKDLRPDRPHRFRGGTRTKTFRPCRRKAAVRARDPRGRNVEHHARGDVPRPSTPRIPHRTDDRDHGIPRRGRRTVTRPRSTAWINSGAACSRTTRSALMLCVPTFNLGSSP